MNETTKKSGPVITISREYGSNATIIGELVTKKMTELTGNKWQCVTHQILLETAEALKVDEVAVSHIFEAYERNILSQLFDSVVEKYPSDSKIKKTLSEIVRKYAEVGNYVIVGRAGCVIAHDIKKSLHIKITAPYQYKIDNLMHSLCLSEADAIINYEETTIKRENFMNFFREGINDSELFDVVFCRAKFSTNVIVEEIIRLAKAMHLY